MVNGIKINTHVCSFQSFKAVNKGVRYRSLICSSLDHSIHPLLRLGVDALTYFVLPYQLKRPIFSPNCQSFKTLLAQKTHAINIGPKLFTCHRHVKTFTPFDTRQKTNNRPRTCKPNKNPHNQNFKLAPQYRQRIIFQKEHPESQMCDGSKRNFSSIVRGENIPMLTTGEVSSIKYTVLNRVLSWIWGASLRPPNVIYGVHKVSIVTPRARSHKNSAAAAASRFDEGLLSHASSLFLLYNNTNKKMANNLPSSLFSASL